MKTLLVMDSVSRAGGGVLDAERCLHQGLARLGVETLVYALEDPFSSDDLPTWSPLAPKVFPHVGPFSLGSAPSLDRAIHEKPADLVYRAGLWRLPSKYAHEWSRRYRKPAIIAPHGMLDPWAVGNSRWKKRLAHLWFEGAHLRDASCIRALCESEANSIRAYGLKNPVCIIPNGIDLPEGASEGRNVEGRKSESPKILLFLGRLHPKKGLINALRAWAEVKGQRSKVKGQEEWQFVIAGWDQGGHEAELKRLCREIGVSEASVSVDQFLAETPASDLRPPSSVLCVGPAFGEQKDALLRSASAFILPSFSEGLPMSVLEAWSYGLPVLMTDHCNLPEGFAADAALRIGTDAESIAEGLRHLFSLPFTDNGQPTTSLRSLGANGRQLVEQKFTWPQVAAQMKEVYEWVLGGGEVPGCVERHEA